MVATVFINELHYDNTGTDTGEFIEIAGPAGTDLTGWSLVLYNGASTVLAAYNTITLSGTIANAGNGFGFVSIPFPTNGIQNGEPDGVALVDDNGDVVQFLSYEGSFTAASGPAAGLTSTDIGVAETADTPVGFSLQLTGSGTVYEDFSWAAPADDTPNAVNTGQTFGSASAAPVINEFVFNHTGTDTSEYVEVLASPNTDYSGYSLIQIEGDSGAVGTIDSVTALGTTDAGGFFTTSFLNNVYENGTVTLLLVKDFTGSVGNDLDANDDGVLDSTPWSEITDAVAVSDAGSGDRTYTSVVLAPGFDGVSFIPGGASRIPNGTDTDTGADWVRNDFDLAGLPGFPGTPIVGEALNTPGAANALVPDTEVNVTRIFDIQGASHTSALVGQRVTTTGIVTAVDSNGFYLQDATGDGSIATSDGIFVFTSSRPAVNVGDELQVEGTVSEFIPGGASTGNLSVTQIGGNLTLTTLSTGNALPAAVVLGVDRTPPTEIIDDDQATAYNVLQGGGVYDPTTDGLDFYESLEGMRVTINDARAVSGTNRFGEIFTVANNGAGATGLSDRGTINIAPDDFNPERIQVQFDSGILPGFSQSVDVGAELGDVTGVVGYNFGNFEVNVTEAFTPVKDSTLKPEATALEGATDLTIASYNVLNLDPNDSDGDTDVANGRFEAIAQHIVNNLGTPDVIGLQEIQDSDGSVNSSITAADATLQALVDAIAAAGGPTYQFIDNPFIGDDLSGGQPGGNIRTAFLYNPDRVSLVNGSVQTIGSQQPGGAFEETRLPLVATFDFKGQEVTVINNHFSSKGGSSPLFGATQPAADLQDDPSINGSLDQRRAQAEAVKAYVDSLLASNADANIAVVGDFNEFEFISPLNILEQSLTNLTETLPANERYSFIFDGNSQSLDHILVSNNLADDAQFDIVHVNTEFADSDSRASDHDPLLARLSFPTSSTTNLRFGQRNAKLIMEVFQDGVLTGEERGRQNRPAPSVSPFDLFAVDSADSDRRRSDVVDKTFLDQGEGIGVSDGDDGNSAHRKRIDGDEILGIGVTGFQAKDALINVDRIASSDGAEIKVTAFRDGMQVDSDIFVLGQVPTRGIQTLEFSSSSGFDTLHISAADADTRFTFRTVELPSAIAV